MTTIYELQEAIASIDLIKDSMEIVVNTGKDIIQENQDQLYKKGIGADNRQLPVYKNKYYAKKKNLMNPQPGFGQPDLYLSGKFFKGMKLTTDGNQFEVTSNADDAKYLVQRYTDEIYGMTEESRKEYVENKFWPALIAVIEKKTGLKFS